MIGLTVRTLFIAALFLASASAAIADGSGGINALEHRDKPYLVLISIDGFRWDYQDLHDTPALDRIAAAGVRAERMVPVFPTLTFPNHYSIATGLYPANHGLIGNTFPNAERTGWYSISDRETVEDGRWYRGEPVWVAVEKAGMVTVAPPPFAMRSMQHGSTVRPCCARTHRRHGTFPRKPDSPTSSSRRIRAISSIQALSA